MNDQIKENKSMLRHTQWYHIEIGVDCDVYTFYSLSYFTPTVKDRQQWASKKKKMKLLVNTVCICRNKNLSSEIKRQTDITRKHNKLK